MTDTPIEAGTARAFLGRDYTAVEVTPHMCRNGRMTQLIRWRGQCRHCGQPFDMVAGARARRLTLNCSQHRGMRAASSI